MIRRSIPLSVAVAFLCSCSPEPAQPVETADWLTVEDLAVSASDEGGSYLAPELVVNSESFVTSDFVEAWGWLTGPDVSPRLITALGDLVVEGPEGDIYLVDSKNGSMDILALSQSEFMSRLSDSEFVERVFQPSLVNSLYQSGMVIGDEEVFSITEPVNRGGSLTPDNFLPIDANVHFFLMGQIHEQIRPIPEGTEIDSISIE